MAEKLKIRSIIEIVGSPKNHVEQTLDKVFDELKKREYLKVLKEKKFEVEQIKDKPLWTAFVEVDLEVKDFSAMFDFAFDCLPSSIEILEPDNIKMERKEVEDIMNDVLARLHQYNMVLQNIHAENVLLKKKDQSKA